MGYTIAFFGAKPYDISSFDQVNEAFHYDIKYYKGHLNKNNLVLTLKPIIHSSYFDKEGKFYAKLFAATDIVYVNKPSKNTYLPKAEIKKIHIQWNNGKKDEIDGNKITGKFAVDIRNRQAKSITAVF